MDRLKVPSLTRCHVVEQRVRVGGRQRRAGGRGDGLALAGVGVVHDLRAGLELPDVGVVEEGDGPGHGVGGGNLAGLEGLERRDEAVFPGSGDGVSPSGRLVLRLSGRLSPWLPGPTAAAATGDTDGRKISTGRTDP
jgi:hypothetical protein